MKWFAHNTDSYSNLKIQKLRKVFGMEGIGFWWFCCELVGQQGNDYTVEKDKDWLAWLELQTGLPIERIMAILEKMAEFRLISKEKYEKGHLSIPQLPEYSDNYTKRVRRVSEQGANSVRQQYNTIQDNTTKDKPMTSLLEWAEKKREGKFPSPKKQFTAMAIMKKAGIEVGRIKERWEEMEIDPFWQDKGFDFMNVAKSFDKKR